MPQRTAPFEAIAACHPTLSDAASAEVADWFPDVVPSTVGLGALGAALVFAGRDIAMFKRWAVEEVSDEPDWDVDQVEQIAFSRPPAAAAPSRS